MRPLLIAILFLLPFLNACNKCKDDPCKNGGTCDKITGDCLCPSLYEGTDCSIESRKKHEGVYIGKYTLEVDTFFAVTVQDTLEIEAEGGAETLGWDKKGTMVFELISSSAFKMKGKYKIDSVSINAVEIPGSFRDGRLVFDGTIIYEVADLEFPGRIKFDGKKE
jgi:hypothetical protein